jgi:hypothetical protein
MPDYRFYKIGGDGHVAGPPENIELPNDGAAMQEAKKSSTAKTLRFGKAQDSLLISCPIRPELLLRHCRHRSPKDGVASQKKSCPRTPASFDVTQHGKRLMAEPHNAEQHGCPKVDDSLVLSPKVLS